MMDAFPYAFSLDQLYNPQFALLDLNVDPQESADFDIGIQMAAMQEQGQVLVLINARMRQKDKLLAFIQAGCAFRMEASSWEAMVREDGILIPKELCAHLSMIAMGTLRGVLFAKTAGSPLQRFPLPLINVSSLFEGDLKVPFLPPQPPAQQSG